MKKLSDKLRSVSYGESEHFRMAVTAGEWLIVTAVLLLSYLIFFYTDFSDTLDNGILLAESVAKGRFTEYYRYAAENAHEISQYSANYSIFLYGIFAVWNLPAAVLHAVTHFDYMNSVPALLWCKALILAAIVASSVMVRKITSLFADKRAASLAQILFLGSSCVVVPAMVTVQYDILSIFLMLCGIWFYLRDREWMFILFFALAVPLKLFALFAFIPLILLREKRLPVIVLKLIPAFAVNFICSLPFRGDPWYELCLGTQNRDAVDLILRGGITVGGYEFNLFIAAYLVICVLCYVCRDDTGDGADDTAASRCYLPLYASFAAFASFTAFTDFRSYWVILIVPFAVFVSFFNRDKLRANVLLLTVGTACYTLYSYIHHWILSTGSLVGELAFQSMADIPGENRKWESVKDMLCQMGIDKYENLLRTLFTASLILLLVINLPKIENIRKWVSAGYRHEWWHGLMQGGVTAVLVAVLLYANLATVPTAVIDFAGKTDIYTEADIFAGSVIRQSFSPAEDAKVSKLSFIAKNSNTYRSLRCAAVFTLTDDTDGITLYHGLVGTPLIDSEEIYTIDIGKIDLIAGHEYTLTISGDIAQKRGRTVFNLGMTDEVMITGYPAEIDGVPQNCNLAFTIR